LWGASFWAVAAVQNYQEPQSFLPGDVTLILIGMVLLGIVQGALNGAIIGGFKLSWRKAAVAAGLCSIVLLLVFPLRNMSQPLTGKELLVLAAAIVESMLAGLITSYIVCNMDTSPLR
jgi:hypothetical protein